MGKAIARCYGCGAELAYSGTGRPPKWCPDCRRDAEEERRAARVDAGAQQEAQQVLAARLAWGRRVDAWHRAQGRLVAKWPQRRDDPRWRAAVVALLRKAEGKKRPVGHTPARLLRMPPELAEELCQAAWPE